ncbi:hypothetical protein V8E53_003354 [Lactarius tabidus]
MVSGTILVTGAIIALASRVSAHASIFTPSMWGFNKTDVFRPQDPLINCTFDQWWFHGHLGYPPHPGDIEQLPVGGTHNFEISCDKDATSYWPSGPGGNQIDPNDPDNPCPGRPSTAIHANNISDVAGCGLAVAYKSDVSEVTPEDFVIFSINQTCVWYRNTTFEIPAMMPKCPDDKCICAWFWTHYEDSGSEQMYMTGFQCNMKGANSTDPLPPPQLPRRCGQDPIWGTPADPSNCTHGPKSPMYWYQAEGNNMFEDTYHAPVYNPLYGFNDGAQIDIFWPNGDPSNQTYNTSSSIPSNANSSSVLSSTPLAGDLPVSSSSSPAPLPSSSSYPPASSPLPSTTPAYSADPELTLPSSSSSSYPPAGNMDPSDTLPTSSTDSYLPQSYQPSQSPSSSPSPLAGNVSPSDTQPTPSTDSYLPQSYQPSQSPSSSPSPTHTNDPEHQSQPSSGSKKKCAHRQKPSGVYSPSPSESPAQDHTSAPPANAHAPPGRRISSHEDKLARRVWGHRHRGADKHNA